MIESPLHASDLADDELPAAPPVSLFSTSHRWWRLLIDPTGSSPPALAGLATGVLWPSAVTEVPCPQPTDGTAGPCRCGLHAPATAAGQARSLGSVVVGGTVRVLSSVGAASANGHGPRALVAIEGPLHLLISCAGPQDGFSLAGCDARPHWVVPHGGVTAVCRRHRSEIPRRLRRNAMKLRQFETEVITGLAKRYGLDVASELDPDRAEAGRRNRGASGRRGHLLMRRSHPSESSVS